MNIYVGNVPYAATETDLEELFGKYGPVATATIIRDRYDGRSKGFGFVEMKNQTDGKRAIEALDGSGMMGRPLKVNPARPRNQRLRKSQHNDEKKKSSPKFKGASDKKFHNSYTFVPTPPRPLGNIADEFAGDFNPLKHDPPLDHASLKAKLWTGYIPIKLTTVTPLVLLDAGEEDRSSDVHQTYDVLDYIPEPSLRGMLRSAYEVVTNSRYGHFGIDTPLKYKEPGQKERKEYSKSPLELLDLSLHPATSMETLSPADRLFGWVPSPVSSHYRLDRNIHDLKKQHARRVTNLTKNEREKKNATAHTYVYQSLQYLEAHDPNEFRNLMNKEVVKEIYDKCQERAKHVKGGYKSRLRVVCEDGSRPEIVQRFETDQHLSLAVLAQPKPSYARFYVAKSPDGDAQDDGIDMDAAGYSKGKGLRGRKQYWHHQRLPDDYWKLQIETQEQSSDVREYIRLNEKDKPQKDHQNRSVRGWIKPGTVFKVALYVQNLQCAEVGALLWLLTLNDEIHDDGEKHCFRLGYGKPLGFGSVTIEIDKDRCPDGHLSLGTGEHWKDNYKDFYAPSAPAKLGKDHQKKYIQKFEEKMKKTYKAKHFDNLSFIAGFQQVLLGPKTDGFIHYPRIGEKPDPDGKHYEWFNENEKGQKLALPAVTKEKKLPYSPKT